MNGQDNSLGAFLFTVLCMGSVIGLAVGVQWFILLVRAALETTDCGLAPIDDELIDWRQSRVDVEFERLVHEEWRRA